MKINVKGTDFDVSNIIGKPLGHWLIVSVIRDNTRLIATVKCDCGLSNTTTRYLYSLLIKIKEGKDIGCIDCEPIRRKANNLKRLLEQRERERVIVKEEVVKEPGANWLPSYFEVLGRENFVEENGKMVYRRKFNERW